MSSSLLFPSLGLVENPHQLCSLISTRICICGGSSQPTGTRHDHIYPSNDLSSSSPSHIIRSFIQVLPASGMALPRSEARWSEQGDFGSRVRHLTGYPIGYPRCPHFVEDEWVFHRLVNLPVLSGNLVVLTAPQRYRIIEMNHCISRWVLETALS
ncbi:hypothetical protein BXZ70DRAFT_203997 [Cristinia sonorae]|uniref:Uncharacterized protein n=1 Tax=Cristinia sonorae TaxID=1940300 RepID=A0A8K0UND6_9AGAR|nr:hypothetical protein BXZ70DRAFT_203997 [Cristinia sonorae]